MTRLKMGRPLNDLGRFSNPMYLSHQVIGSLVFDSFAASPRTHR